MQVLILCCWCQRHDLLSMLAEAAENFHLLPKVTFADGTEVPYTADVDIRVLNLESFNDAIPRQSYYQGKQ